MNDYFISYTLTTFNKLPFLKVTLPWWLKNINENEQLVIVDGNSKDGTSDFIKQHIQNHTNIIFISEDDCGEAHGLNKAIMLSEGKYIKTISDDDVFNISAIRKSAQWLEEHPNIDWMSSNGLSTFFQAKKLQFNLKNEEIHFKKYKNTHKPFISTGLGYLIRKKSISKLGLFNTDCKIVDIEFSLRNLSNHKIQFAFCTTPFYINIVNPASNSITMFQRLIHEYSKWYSFYHKNPIKIYAWKLYLTLSYYIYRLKGKSDIDNNKFNYERTFEEALKQLDLSNQSELKILV